jgi:hypothetical protein
MKTYTDGRNPGVRECRAGPGRPSVTDPSSVTDGRSEFIYKISLSQRGPLLELTSNRLSIKYNSPLSASHVAHYAA